MVKERIVLNNPERFAKPHVISKEKLTRAAEAACNKLEENTKKYGIAFPDTRSIEYRYRCGENNNWECGMYTGCYWRAWELTGNKFFKETAEAHLATYEERFEKKVGMDDHDVGFVFSPSCIAAYKLTGNEYARDLALKAAEYFYEKSYSKEGKFIIRYWKC